MTDVSTRPAGGSPPASERRARTRARLLDAFREIAVEILGGAAVDETLEVIAGRAKVLVDADEATVALGEIAEAPAAGTMRVPLRSDGVDIGVLSARRRDGAFHDVKVAITGHPVYRVRARAGYTAPAAATAADWTSLREEADTPMSRSASTLAESPMAAVVVLRTTLISAVAPTPAT